VAVSQIAAFKVPDEKPGQKQQSLGL